MVEITEEEEDAKSYNEQSPQNLKNNTFDITQQFKAKN